MYTWCKEGVGDGVYHVYTGKWQCSHPTCISCAIFSQPGKMVRSSNTWYMGSPASSSSSLSLFYKATEDYSRHTPMVIPQCNTSSLRLYMNMHMVQGRDRCWCILCTGKVYTCIHMVVLYVFTSHLHLLCHVLPARHNGRTFQHMVYGIITCFLLLLFLSGEEPVAPCAQLSQQFRIVETTEKGNCRIVHTMMCACVHVRTQATYMYIQYETKCRTDHTSTCTCTVGTSMALNFQHPCTHELMIVLVHDILSPRMQDRITNLVLLDRVVVHIAVGA